MAITTIISDLGGVVMTNDGVRNNTRILEYFRVSSEEASKAWEVLWPGYRTGKITEEQFWTEFLKLTGAKEADIEQAKQIYRESPMPSKPMLTILERLKGHYKLAAFTDAGKEWLAFEVEKFRLDKYFEVIVSSSDAGLAKPDPRFYFVLMERLGVEPENCLFIDDKPANLVPARQLGMSTILFRGVAELEMELGRLGIKYKSKDKS